MANRDEILRFVVQTEGSESLRAMSKDIDLVTDAAAKGEPKAQQLVSEFKRLNEASNAVNGLAQLKAKLQDTGDQLWQAKRGLEQLNREFSASDRSSGIVAKAFKRAEETVARLTKEEKQLEVAVLKASGTIQKHGLDVNNLTKAEQELGQRVIAANESLRLYASASKSAADATKKAATETGGATSRLDKFRAGLNSVAKSLLQVTGIAGAVSAALGAIGVGRIFGGAIDSATEFEAKLSEIRAVSGASTEQLARMKKAAEDATRTTKFTASEAADALGELARASGDADAAIAQLAPTLNLAQAAGIGTAEAATILTTTLTQFGLAATDATRVADIFAREANSTQDTVSSLGNAMSYVAPLARQLGLSLEQTTAILGALAQEGFKGERAGTALRNVFSQLLDPASKFSGALRGLGINSSDFTEVIGKLAAAGDKGKAALLSLDSEARPAIQALVTSGGANIKRLIEDFKQAGGEAERTARTMGDNFDGATKRLRSALDQLQRSLVDPILEPLKSQFDDVAERIRAFVQAADFSKIVVAVRGFALQATEALIALGRNVDYSALAEKIQQFGSDAAGFFRDIKENASAAISVIGAAVAGISTVFNSLQAVILTAATVITGVLTGIAASALATATALSKLPGAGEAMKGVVEELQTVVGGLTAVTKDFAERAGQNFVETGQAAERFGDAVVAASNAAGEGATKVDQLGEASKGAAPQIGALNDELDFVPDYATTARDGLSVLVDPIRNVGRDSLLSAQHVTKFSTEVQKLGGGPVAEAAKKVREADAALSALVRSGNATPEAINAAVAAIRTARGEFEQVKASAGRAKEGTDAVKGAFTDLGVVSQAALQEAADKARVAFESIRANSNQTAAGLADTRNAFIAYAEKAIEASAAADAATKASTESMLRGIAQQIGAVDQLNAALSKGGASANLFKPPTDGLRQMGGAAQQTASDVKSVGDAAQDAGAKTGDFAQRGGDALAALTNEIAGVRSEFLALSESAAKAFDDAFKNASRAFTSIGAGLGFDSIRDAMRSAQQEVEQSIANQRAQLASLIGDLTIYAETGQGAFAGVAASAEASTARLDGLTVAVQDGTSSFNLLGSQDLQQLQAAIDRAREKTEELKRQADDATQSLLEMARSTQDEIDQALGNQDAIEQRRHEQRLQQIKQEAELAGAAGTAAAQEAIANENLLHAIKMENIRKEQAEREKSGGGNGGGSTPPAPPPAPARPNGGGGGGISQPVINVTIQGNVIGNEQFTRELSKDLKRLWGRGG